MPSETERLNPGPPDDDAPLPADLPFEVVDSGGLDASDGADAADPRAARKRGRTAASTAEPGPAGDEPPPPADPEGNPSPAAHVRPAPDPAASVALAAKIVSRLNPEQARAVTTTEG
ncbi:MAG: hypothetical protein ACRDGQ_01190, partial [Candidatus Limnocylindrales bacterium]